MSRRHRPKKQDPEVLRTEREILHVEEQILRTEEQILHELHRLHPHLTASIVLQFSGASIMANNTLSLTVGQSSVGTITPLLTDGVTPSGGTVSGATFSIPADPSFSAVDNGDGTLTVTGVAASAAAVTGTASATVTDTDSAVSTFTATFTITVIDAVVTPPPAEATTASIVVSFSAPK
jgi:hypothetical protein